MYHVGAYARNVYYMSLNPTKLTVVVRHEVDDDDDDNDQIISS